MKKLNALIAGQYQLSVLINSANPDHHVWRNLDGTWWMKLTLWGATTKKRIDLPLLTRSLDEARRLRDEIIAYMPHARTQRVRRDRQTKQTTKGFFVCDCPNSSESISGRESHKTGVRCSAKQEPLDLAAERNP